MPTAHPESAECPIVDHLRTQKEPTTGVVPQHISRFCTACRQREEAIGLARQFIHLIKAVQRHRGFSMALLAGDTSFEKQFEGLEAELERRLACLQAFSTNTYLLSDHDQENLRNAWMTLCRNWHNDDVIDNFELHSHVIEQLLSMLAALARQLEKPVSVKMAESDPEAANRKDLAKILRQVEVLNFIALQIPQMVEQVARIRGLATYALSANCFSRQLKLKLRYAIQRVRTQSDELGQYAERLQEVLADGKNTLGPLKKHEIRLMFLLNRIEVEIFSGVRASVSGQHFFSLATDIIEVYLHVVDEGMNLIARWHEQDLDAWLNSGTHSTPY